MMWGWGDGPWFFGPVVMVVFMLICMGMMFFMMRGMMGGMMDGHGRPKDNALGILKERLARGEINQGQYDEMRRALEA